MAPPVAVRHRPFLGGFERRPPTTYADGVTTDETDPICSAKGCTEPAKHQLLWNNPKLHTPDRRKTWLACDEHEEYLRKFLSARGFWKATEPFTHAD